MNNRKTTLIEYTIGYCLKLLKNNIDIQEFNEEFNSIKHGNYDNFLRLIEEKNVIKRPWCVEWNDFIIKKDNFSTEVGTCDFAMILQSGNALKKFYDILYNKYNNIIDTEINDEIYYKLALFEINILLHCNNNNLLNDINIQNRKLEDAINKLCIYKNINNNDCAILHRGRLFLNFIKHKTNKFINIEEGIKEFNKAFDILIINNLTLI